MVSYAYDTLNRLTEINGFNNTKLTFDYDRAGRRTKLNNAIKDVDYKYDIASRLTSVLTNGLSVNYGHDANGNRNSMSINREGLSAINNNLSFDYDKTGQLVGATNPLKGEDNESFTYDDLGNRLLRNGQTTQASYDLNNRLLENETHFFAYDNNGNMVSQTNKASGEVELYTWTSENQLVRIEKKPSLLENATSVIQYEYDVFGRRIYKNIDGLERSYIYDREDILAIFEKQEDGSFNLAMKYLHGPGIDEPIKGFGRDFNETYYADGLGSIVKVERDNGEFFNLVYDSFGRMTVFDKEHQKVTLGKDSLLTYGYTGREIDAESGFNYYRARYYSPEIGRFVSEDPILHSKGELNSYRYVLNSPHKFVDPTGESFMGVITIGCTAITIANVLSLASAIDAQMKELESFNNEILRIQDYLIKNNRRLKKKCKDRLSKHLRFLQELRLSVLNDNEYLSAYMQFSSISAIGAFCSITSASRL
jgi:RHS repeat-associated protein